MHVQSCIFICIQDELDNFGHIPGVDPAFITLITLPPAESHGTATTISTEADQEKQISQSKRATTKSSKRRKTSATKTLSADTETRMEREPHIKEVPIHVQDLEVDPTSIEKELPLVPPRSLFENRKYQPLHIFVSES